MSWFKVDDGFLTHPKVYGIKAGPLALWLRAGCWCAGELTDGRIPARALRGLEAKPAHVKELVDRGLWDPADDGFQFHDWLDYQPSREQVLRERAATRDRVERFREKKAARPVSETSPESAQLVKTEAECFQAHGHPCNGVSNGHVTPAPVPVPVPTNSVNQVGDTEASVPALKPPVTAPTAPPSPAGRASRLIHEATLVEWHPLGKWRLSLEALGAKPDSEWKVATAVLRAEALKPGVARNVLNPTHILDHWSSHYAVGEAPGQRQPLLKLAAAGSAYREL